MKLIGRQAVKLLAALALLIFFQFSLFADDAFDDDDFWDDFLWFEDEIGITVTGTIETTQHMEVITREDIERRGAMDLADILQDSLGVNIIRYGPRGNQTGISMRGFDSRRVAVLINGIPANSPLDNGFDIFQIDPASIERIEVIYGGSDSRFNVSGALGGVINIVTIGRQEPGLRIGASFSNTSALPGQHRGRDGQTHGPHFQDLFDAQNVAISLTHGGEALSVMANVFFNRAENHFLFEDFIGFTRRKDNNEMWDTGGTASFVWQLPNLARLISSSHFYYADKNIPTSGFSAFYGELTDIIGRQSFMLEMPRAFHDDVATEASVTWNTNRRDFTDAGGAFSRHDQHSVMIINRWSWYANRAITLRSGFNYNFTHLDSTEMGERVRHDGGVSLATEIRLAERFFVVPSIKAAITSGRTTEIVPVPKLGLLWNISDSLTLRNNYFRSFKFPAFQDLYWAGGGNYSGNPDLLPQDGVGGDLGLTWNPNSRFRWENVFFTQWTRNSVHWFETAGIWMPENVGAAIFLGLSSNVRFELPIAIGVVERVIASVSYHYLRSHLMAFGFTFADNRRIPYTPMHTISLSLDFPWETGSFVLSGHFESTRYADRANLIALEPYFLLNASYNQRIGRNLTVFGSLRNILNRCYESFAGQPMPGISLTLGARVNFEVSRAAYGLVLTRKSP
jgi:vitamin B12 transporter